MKAGLLKSQRKRVRGEEARGKDAVRQEIALCAEAPGRGPGGQSRRGHLGTGMCSKEEVRMAGYK